MASVNKVILIGSLGRVSRGGLDTAGQQAFDRYVDAACGYGSVLRDGITGLAEAARRLAEAYRQLHKLASPFVIPKKIAAPWTPLFGRTAAFFHAAKVDARNLP